MTKWVDANPYLTFYTLPGGSKAYHTGADLNLNVPKWDADKGASVHAIGNGVVTHARLVPKGTWGRLIVIRHIRPNGDIVHSRYGHLASMAVKEGQIVKIGDAIGTIGGAEWGMPNHLHFDISDSGVLEKEPTHWPGANKEAVETHYVDPKAFLKQFAPPAPPPAGGTSTVDLLPFLRGTHRRQFDQGYVLGGSQSGTQTIQVWHLSPAEWLFIKGEHGEYERLALRPWNGQEWIWRLEDTSESPERFYGHYLNQGGALGAPWMPRHAVVGRWYETTKFVQHYLKAGCVPQNSGTVTDKLRVVSHPRAFTYADSLARLDRVITMEWGGGEQYDFAEGLGCVAFRDAGRRFWFIGELHGRADRVPKRPGCIQW